MNAPFQANLSVGSSPYDNYSYQGGPNSQQYNFNPSPVAQTAQNPLGWSNYQTYAPNYTPQMTMGSIGSNGLGVGNDFNWMTGGGSFFGLGNKKQFANFNVPSYQGTLFNPNNDPGNPWAQGGTYGIGSNNYASQGQQAGIAASMPTSSALQGTSGSVNAGVSGIESGGQFQNAAGSLSPSQSYVGQSVYNMPGQTYVPQSGGMSYGGYSNYGGYGASGAGTQPYFPGQ